jgi:hypothetical protein
MQLYITQLVAVAVAVTEEFQELQVVLVAVAHTTVQVALQSQIIILVLGVTDFLLFFITQLWPAQVVRVRAM